VGVATTWGGVVTVVVRSALTTGDAPPFDMLIAPMISVAATDAATNSLRTRRFQHRDVEIISYPSQWQPGETRRSPKKISGRPRLWPSHQYACPLLKR
jgi:hypothetical protein